MSNTISATELKNKAADVLNQVVYTKAETIIMRHGKPIAVISPIKKRESSKANIKKVLDDTFGAIPDFPDVVRERRASRSFFKLAGILSDSEAGRMKRIVSEGRSDGSRYKKYLAKW